MVLDDDQIERSRIEDARRSPSRARREAAEEQRNRKAISHAAAKAKKAKDSRAYGECLRLLRIAEDSPEWKNAWDFFYRG